jgi:4-oxalocrotonate tautomerase family enzyme
MLDGHTAIERDGLIRELADAVMRALKVPENSIRIILTEVPADRWGVGRQSMSALRSSPRAE